VLWPRDCLLLFWASAGEVRRLLLLDLGELCFIE
jgi:hypothetical protein